MRRAFLLLSISIVLASCASWKGKPGGVERIDPYPEYDLVLVGIPRKVELISAGSFSNAVEYMKGSLKGLETIVSFRVVDVLKEDALRGKQRDGKKKKLLPALNLNQLVQSLNPKRLKDIKNIFGRSNITSKDIRSRWFRVAVKDAYDTFGVYSWSDIEPTKHQMYFKRYETGDDNYVMVKHTKLNASS